MVKFWSSNILRPGIHGEKKGKRTGDFEKRAAKNFIADRTQWVLKIPILMWAYPFIIFGPLMNHLRVEGRNLHRMIGGGRWRPPPPISTFSLGMTPSALLLCPTSTRGFCLLIVGLKSKSPKWAKSAQGVSVGWGRVFSVVPILAPSAITPVTSERDGDDPILVPIPLTGTGVIAAGVRMGTKKSGLCELVPIQHDTPWIAPLVPPPLG